MTGNAAPPCAPPEAAPTGWRLALGLSALAMCFLAATACSTRPVDGDPSPSGCLGTPAADVPATVGQPMRIGATVTADGCSDFPVLPEDDDLFKNEISVGDEVRLRLVGPLLPVRIEPISSEVQRLSPEHPSASWQWQLVADEPGVHRLSIVASVLDPEDGEILLENREIEVRLHAEGTVGYYAGRTWIGLSSFIMSAQGMVIGVAALASALGGGWLARRRSRAAREQEPEPAVERGRDRDPSGYL